MSDKNDSDVSKSSDVMDPMKRQRLVARVAGSVASGIVVAPSKKVTSAADIAEIAVDVAEEIVRRVGL